MTQVLVTRPVQDAAAWMHAIEEAGWEAIEFPLLDVSPTLHLEGRQAVYQHILKSQAVMFVSANAEAVADADADADTEDADADADQDQDPK